MGVDVVKVLVGICEGEDVVGGAKEGAKEGETDVVTEVSCEHTSSYQVEAVGGAGMGPEQGLSFDRS